MHSSIVVTLLQVRKYIEDFDLCLLIVCEKFLCPYLSFTCIKLVDKY